MIGSSMLVLDAVLLRYNNLANRSLAEWTPEGIFQWFLESIQVITGMP
jgi:hypothetical protein